MDTTLSSPVVRTAIPGPLSKEFLDRQELCESNARTYPRGIPIAIRKAAGSYIEDVDGNVFIDFLCAAGALPLGHNPPLGVLAVSAQMQQCSQALDMPTPVKREFTELLTSLLPQPMRERMKVHFCGPTGADAVEAALKLAKFATGRGEVFTFQGGYHGCTNGAMSVTGLLGPKRGIPNLMPGVHFFPYSYCYRCPLDLAPDTCATNCITYLERTLADPNGGHLIPAAVIVELVQGEGGVIPARPEFIARLYGLTREHGIVFIADEVQTGFGRTGNWFAFEHYGIEPDIILMSKAMGGFGLPVSAIMYDRKLDIWPPGKHIGTFRGNQLGFAAGLAVLRHMRDGDTLTNVRERGEEIARYLRMLQRRYPFMGDVRGAGLMQGCEIVDPATRRIDSSLAARVRRRALASGLILELGGRHDGVLRLLPPLNVTRDTVNQAMTILGDALADVAEGFHIETSIEATA